MSFQPLFIEGVHSGSSYRVVTSRQDYPAWKDSLGIGGQMNLAIAGNYMRRLNENNDERGTNVLGLVSAGPSLEAWDRYMKSREASKKRQVRARLALYARMPPLQSHSDSPLLCFQRDQHDDVMGRGGARRIMQRTVRFEGGNFVNIMGDIREEEEGGDGAQPNLLNEVQAAAARAPSAVVQPYAATSRMGLMMGQGTEEGAGGEGLVAAGSAGANDGLQQMRSAMGTPATAAAASAAPTTAPTTAATTAATASSAAQTTTTTPKGSGKGSGKGSRGGRGAASPPTGTSTPGAGMMGLSSSYIQNSGLDGLAAGSSSGEAEGAVRASLLSSASAPSASSKRGAGGGGGGAKDTAQQ